MNGRIVNLALLILTALMVYVFVYMGNHDRVAEVTDVSSLRLNRGRTVHLLGVLSTAIRDSVQHPEMPAGELTWSVVEVDTPGVNEVQEKAGTRPVTLKYVPFEPDSSSDQLHAYVYLHDGTMLNEWLIEHGVAAADPAVEHPQKQHFLELQTQAEREQRGIWKPAEPAAAGTSAQTVTAMPGGKGVPREMR